MPQGDKPVIRNNIEAKDANGNTTIYRKNTV